MKKATENKKVYVLLYLGEDSSGNHFTWAKVFSTLKLAQQEMAAQYNAFLNDYDEDDIETFEIDLNKGTAAVNGFDSWDSLEITEEEIITK